VKSEKRKIMTIIIKTKKISIVINEFSFIRQRAEDGSNTCAFLW
jgi:hypothetical protein